MSNLPTLLVSHCLTASWIESVDQLVLPLLITQDSGELNNEKKRSDDCWGELRWVNRNGWISFIKKKVGTCPDVNGSIMSKVSVYTMPCTVTDCVVVLCLYIYLTGFCLINNIRRKKKLIVQMIFTVRHFNYPILHITTWHWVPGPRHYKYV